MCIYTIRKEASGMKDYSLERCHCASSNCYCANIKRAENKITALYNHHLEKAGITRGQYALLANIERNPGISVSALAETMDLERTTLVRNLKPLEARGLIVDAACKGRSRSLQLSAEGKETFARARIYWQQAQDELEAFLGQEQIAELNHLISAILELN